MRTLGNEASISSRSSKSATDLDRLLVSVRSSNAGGRVNKPAVGDRAVGSGNATRSRRQHAPAHRDAPLEEPISPAPMIAGAAAMVAGGPRHRDKTASAATNRDASDDQAAKGPGRGAIGQEDDDISPRTAKKVLPHFLAIGNPGSQALVAKEGAEIVQKQAREKSPGARGRLGCGYVRISQLVAGQISNV